MMLSDFNKHKTLIYDRSMNPRAIAVDAEAGYVQVKSSFIYGKW